MLLPEEIAEERSVAHLNREVASPSGFVKVTHVCKTLPMVVWRLETTQRVMECAGKHLVALGDGNSTFCQVERLAPGMLVVSENGYEAVVSVTRLDEEREMYDLRVEGPDHVYYTNGLLSHNSTGLGVAMLFQFNQIPHHRELYIAPLKEQVKTFADKLQEMQRGSIHTPELALAHGLRNNLYFKESLLGGSLRLQHLLTDPSRVRGQTVDVIRVDEAQDFDSEHLPELRQVQKASHRPSLVFAGTSKEPETCLEVQYQKGSRGVWNIRGGKPGLWWALDQPEDIARMMSVDGLRCPVTKRLLNPMDGEFVHAEPDLVTMGRPSFHLPQLIVPEYASGDKWLEIWTDYKDYPWAKFLKEVMGIPVDSGQREITEADLEAMCDKDMTFERIQAEVMSGKRHYRWIISGCDWGGSDYSIVAKTKVSYTVHVMIGVTGEGNLELIHCRRYDNMLYMDISADIVRNHNRLRGFAIATDNGVGQYYNSFLRDCGQIRTDRFFVFQYNDVKSYLAPIDNDMFALYSLNRTESISALFADVKKPRSRLKCPAWSQSAQYLMDFCNSRRVVTETQSGKGVLRYMRHGSKADDVMHAINFATTLARVLMREAQIPAKQVMEEINYRMGTPFYSPGAGGGVGYVSA